VPPSVARKALLKSWAEAKAQQWGADSFAFRQLRDYQMSGVAWMYGMWLRGLPIGLADDRGLGKRPMTVSWLSLITPWGESERDGTTTIVPRPGTAVEVRDGCGILIVSPACLVPRWIQQFAVWEPRFRLAHPSPESPLEDVNHSTVCIVTLEDAAAVLPALASRVWRCVVLDASISYVVHDSAGIGGTLGDPTAASPVGALLEDDTLPVMRQVSRLQSRCRVLYSNRLLPTMPSHVAAVGRFLLPDVFPCV
jgi:hypothetical protein